LTALKRTWEKGGMQAINATAPGPPAERPDRVFLFLASLRTSLVRIGFVVLGLSIGGYYLAEPILRHLHDRTGVKLAAFGIPETFFTLFGLALAFGVFMSMPYILHAILAGVKPLFPAFTSRMQWGFWLAASVLFYAGSAFCLQISLPYGIQFLMEFEGPHIEALISVQKFAGFCLVFLFGFGFIFELPLVMILLGRIGLVPRQTFARNRRYAILAITIIAAVLTPTPDAFNLGLMAAPLYLLFEIGLVGMSIYRAPGN
jgi:sec-independent protein translocase protein TatC